MFCPRCGANQSEELKYCKTCGTNLKAVRQTIDPNMASKGINWGSSWVAEMFSSAEEAERRKIEIDRIRGITPEIKRYNEIKAGVIVGSVGFALMIFLHVLMEGIVASGKVPADTAEILSRIFIAGILPVFVGLALIINGVFISKKQVEISKRVAPGLFGQEPERPALQAANTSEFVPSSFSVTEETTKHLRSHREE